MIFKIVKSVPLGKYPGEKERLFNFFKWTQIQAFQSWNEMFASHPS